MFGIRKFGAAIAILLVLSVTAFADNSSFTIRDLEMKQRELINAKLQAELNKLQDKKERGSAPVAASIPTLSAPVKTVEKNDNETEVKKEKGIILVAVYGVDKSLTADLLINGAIVSAKQDDVVNGWKIKKVQPTHVVMDKNGVTKTFTVSVDDKTKPDERQQQAQQAQVQGMSPFPVGSMVASPPQPPLFPAASQIPNTENQ